MKTSIIILMAIIIGLLFCLGIILIKPTNNQILRKVVFIIVPVISTFFILIIISQSTHRRNANLRELHELIRIIEYDIECNKVFKDNDDKYECIAYLEASLKRVNNLAYEDSLISLISGIDETMLNNIAQTRNVLNQQIKRIRRLNDFYEQKISYDIMAIDSTFIQIISPTTIRLPTINIAFKSINTTHQPQCAYIEITCNDSVTYRNTFTYNDDVNCFVVPNDTTKNEIIKLGYIIAENKQNKYIYRTWKKNTYKESFKK